MRRKSYSKDMKAKVALMALKAQKTEGEIASEFGIHATQVNRWKKAAVDGLPDIFGGSQSKTIKALEAERDRLFQQIGKLQVELDWLKKTTGHLG